MKFCWLFLVLFLLAGVDAKIAAQNKTPQSPAEKAKALVDYYKKKVGAIVLKDHNKKMSGRIVAFRGKGIVFLPEKEGPFFSPKPRYYPITTVVAFLDANGKVVWGQLPVTKKTDYLKIRKYKGKAGLALGYGRHPNSYTFAPLAPTADAYVQELHAGLNIVGQAYYALTPQHNVGFKYLRHSAAAELYSLRADSTAPATPNDDISIQNFMFAFSFNQAVTRRIIFSADVGLGGLIYHNRRSFADSSITISGASISALIGGGLDYMLNRNLALGVELTYLFGSIRDPEVSNKSIDISGLQSLNRFDVNVGVKFYF